MIKMPYINLEAHNVKIRHTPEIAALYKAVGHMEPLSDDEHLTAGDDRLVEGMARMVLKLAVILSHQCNNTDWLPDIYGAGMEGVLASLGAYDRAKSKFSSWSIQYSYMYMNRLIRVMRGGRRPSDKRWWYEVDQVSSVDDFVSVDHGDERKVDFVESDSPYIHDCLDDNHLRDFVDYVLSFIDKPLKRTIVEKVFMEGMNFSEIGRDLGISPRQIAYHYHGAVSALRGNERLLKKYEGLMKSIDMIQR